MLSNQSILRFYRPMPAAPCLAAVLCLLLTQSIAGQTAADFSRDAHKSYLDMLQKAQADGASPAKLGYVWALVASSYQRNGETDAALRAYGQALPLLAKGPDSRVNYATALDNMGEAYLEMGELTEAQRVREKAFQIRTEINNPVDLARSHEHLAEVLLAQHRFKPAQAHAEAAITILTTQVEAVYQQVSPASSVQPPSKPGNTLLAAYITLTYVQCAQSALADCQRSAEMADQIVTRDFSPGSLERAHADITLAFAAWKHGDSEAADRLFQTGLRRMKTTLGESHPVVVISMIEYRDFLRSRHQNASAAFLDRTIKSAQAMRQRQACAQCTVSVAALP